MFFQARSSACMARSVQARCGSLLADAHCLWHTPPVPKSLPYEVLVALRYVRARKFNQRRNRFVSFISFASMAGIALGVAALIVVLSVMNGFQKEVRDRMLSVVSHIEILAPPELSGVSGVSGARAAPVDWQAVLAKAKENPRVVAGAPYVLSQGMLTSGDVVHGAIIRGIIPAAEAGVADIGSKMRGGSLDSLTPGAFNIALGVDLARSMRLQLGDRVVIIAPQGTMRSSWSTHEGGSPTATLQSVPSRKIS